MDIKHKNSSKKTLPLLVGLALVLLAIVIYFTLHKSNSEDVPRVNNETSDSDRKKDLIDSTNPDGTHKKDSGGQNETNNNPPVTESSIRLEISQSDNTIVVKSTLDNVSSGSCTLRAKNGDTEIDQVADILYQPQYSTCMGFSIPVESLGAGEWKITLTIKANGSIITKESTFEVK